MNDAPRFADLSDDQLRVLHSVCESFEQELLDGKSVPIEPLVEGLDQTLKRPLALELMAIEVELGFKGDREPSLENYQSRFPQYRAEISRLFNVPEREQQVQREQGKLMLRYRCLKTCLEFKKQRLGQSIPMHCEP